MRSVMILLALSAIPACFDLVEDGPPPHGGDDDDDDPPDPPRPPGVDLGMDRKVAAGTREHYTGPLLASSYVGVVFESSDPEMLEAHVIDDDEIGFVTHGPGTYTLTAYRQGYPGQPLDTLTIFALPVEEIVLEALGSPEVGPDLEALAVMTGAAATMCATYYGPGHERIPGHGSFTTTGELQVLAEDVPGQANIRSTCFEVGAGDPGTAELVASVEGGLARTLPVEIHAAPASGELRILVYRNGQNVEGTPEPGELATISLVPRTASGLYLAGVEPTWSFTPEITFFPSGGSALFIGPPSGTTTEITATVGDLAFTTTLAIP